MPMIFDAKQVQDIVDRVEAQNNAIENAGKAARERVKQISVDAILLSVPGVTMAPRATTVDAGLWGARADDEKVAIQDKLVWLNDTLRAAADRDGPAEAKHIMSDAFASTAAIVVWIVFALVLSGSLLWVVTTRWSAATNTEFAPRLQAASAAFARLDTAVTRDSVSRGVAVQASVKPAQLRSAATVDTVALRAAIQDSASTVRDAEARQRELRTAERTADSSARIAGAYLQRGGATEDMVLLMVALLGALGGTLHMIGSLVKYVGNRQLKRSWLAYYGSLPFVGAGLAPIVYMLLRVGILTPTGVSNGGSRTSELNLIAIYAFAAMCGIFAKTAMEKLSEVFATIFRTTDRASKDPIGGEKPPGGQAPAPPKVP